MSPPPFSTYRAAFFLSGLVVVAVMGFSTSLMWPTTESLVERCKMGKGDLEACRQLNRRFMPWNGPAKTTEDT